LSFSQLTSCKSLSSIHKPGHFTPNQKRTDPFDRKDPKPLVRGSKKNRGPNLMISTLGLTYPALGKRDFFFRNHLLSSKNKVGGGKGGIGSGLGIPLFGFINLRATVSAQGRKRVGNDAGQRMAKGRRRGGQTKCGGGLAASVAPIKPLQEENGLTGSAINHREQSLHERHRTTAQCIKATGSGSRLHSHPCTNTAKKKRKVYLFTLMWFLTGKKPLHWNLRGALLSMGVKVYSPATYPQFLPTRELSTWGFFICAEERPSNSVGNMDATVSGRGIHSQERRSGMKNFLGITFFNANKEDRRQKNGKERLEG